MKKLLAVLAALILMTGSAFAAGTSLTSILAGSTDVSVVIYISDSTDGSPETGVEHDTAGIDLEYWRPGADKVNITEAALASLATGHTDGGIEHIFGGYYRLDLPDAACATGVPFVLVGGSITDMVVTAIPINLVGYNAQTTLIGPYATYPDP
jgi:hypothetical protein